MAENLWLRLKVYASGGENGLHAHEKEDHAFFVLQGEATFHIGEDEEEVRVGPFEGMMVPKGALYRFASSGPGNLVMLRSGGAQQDGGPERPMRDGMRDFRPSARRYGSDGEERPGDAPTNGTGAMPAVIVPGESFQPL